VIRHRLWSICCVAALAGCGGNEPTKAAPPAPGPDAVKPAPAPPKVQAPPPSPG
jgi:hypothetical protein